MNREEAIKIIRHYECNSEHYEACEMAIKALEQEPKQEWISVEDRLPEEYGEYMITWVSDQTNKPLISIAEYETEIDQWTLDDYINNAYTGVGVIAWMPLPPAYKGDKE